jgi:hypothetical protein
MRHVKPLITLVLACLLAVPAMAQNGNAGTGGLFGQFGLTDEQKATTTLGELKDLVKDQNTMGPQGNMAGMAGADGCNMMGAQAPQGNNMAGMAGADGANMNKAMGPQGNMAGMAGTNGRNMMGAQAPQGCIFGMGGANCNMMGAQASQGCIFGMGGANCNMMGSQALQGNMQGGNGAGPQQQNTGFMNAPNSDAQGPKQ